MCFQRCPADARRTRSTFAQATAQMACPFKIQKKIAPNAYRLFLPRTIRAHPVFNATALKKYNANQLLGHVQPAPPRLTDMGGHTRYIVEKVLSHKKRGARTHYLVKWKGYRDATWEPEEYLMDEAGNELIPLQNYITNLRG